MREALGLNVDARSAELARLALAGDLAGGLRLIASVRDDGADMKKFNKQVAGYLRNLLLAKTGALEALDLPREAAEEAKELASRLDRGEIVRVLRAFAEADFRDDSQSSLPLELAFVESASGAQDVRSQELGARSQEAASEDRSSRERAVAAPVAAGPSGPIVAQATAAVEPQNAGEPAPRVEASSATSTFRAARNPAACSTRCDRPAGTPISSCPGYSTGRAR